MITAKTTEIRELSVEEVDSVAGAGSLRWDAANKWEQWIFDYYGVGLLSDGGAIVKAQ